MQISASPCAYLVCGKAGSGKTTLAGKIEEERNAVRFSKDEWIVALYGRDLTVEEWPDAERRCCDLILKVAAKILSRGVDVILDFGFWYRKEREEAKKAAEAAGARAVIYFLNIPDEVRKARILSRNEKPDRKSVRISMEEFERQLEWFDVPGKEEGMEIIEIT